MRVMFFKYLFANLSGLFFAIFFVLVATDYLPFSINFSGTLTSIITIPLLINIFLFLNFKKNDLAYPFSTSFLVASYVILYFFWKYTVLSAIGNASFL